MTFFLIISAGIALFIYANVKIYKKNYIHVKHFFDDFNDLKKKPTKPEEVELLQKRYAKVFGYYKGFWKQTDYIKSFIKTYNTANDEIKKWNQLYIEKERLRKECTKYFESADRFLKEIDILKQRLIYRQDVEELITNYKDTYDAVTYPAFAEVNKKVPIEFINIYTNINLKVEEWNAEKDAPQYIQNAKMFFEEIEHLRREYISSDLIEPLLVKYRETYDKLKIPAYCKVDKEVGEVFNDTYVNLYKKSEVWNAEYIRKELELNQEFFDDIDGKSLDYQQRTAVIVDDKNNLILAGAGSGKTLTISAKVKYLVKNKNVDPKDILLISFTRKAAYEMTERINERLGIPIEAVTFHKLGLDILQKNQDVNVVEDADIIILDYFKKELFKNEQMLKKTLSFFWYDLDETQDINNYESYGEYIEHQQVSDFETIKSKYNKAMLEKKVEDLQNEHATIRGERVKSIEEALIANYLFLNGINYEYEKEYPFKEENKPNKKYHPDFYLTDYDIYMEHFGINKDGRLPWLSKIEEKKYIDSMNWKRAFHKQNGTKLIETYSYYQKDKMLLKILEKELIENGVNIQPIDIVDVYNMVYVKRDDSYFKEFIKLILTFINLYKANGYSIEQVDSFRVLKPQSYLDERKNIFLDIIKPILIYYEERLKQLNGIDFNDMINMATVELDKNNNIYNYKYIIIDEFQDISLARYRLIKKILDITNAKFVCVGDDWQSIYRFSGSDVTLFSNFEKYFGKVQLLKIEKTYRNSQELLDIAKAFIEKNPEQLKKDLVSDKSISDPIMVMTYEVNYREALKNALTDIYMHFGEEADVMLLGRTNYDIEKYSDYNLSFNTQSKKVYYKSYPKMNIVFNTVHSSKGLEADNVVILNMKNDIMGFPNKISDNSVLSMVMQNQDDYPFAEERRLFYVAITRTKNKVYLISPSKGESIFLNELKGITNLRVYMNKDEKNIEDNPECPRCKTGKLIVKDGERGLFLGCTNYPQCEYSVNNLEIIHTRIRCQACGGYMVRRKGRWGEFFGCCNYPYCKNVLTNNRGHSRRIGFKF